MAAERPIQETVASFLSCMFFCVNSGKTPQVNRVMTAELQATAHLVTERGLSDKEFVDSFLHPIEANIITRFGYPKSSQPFDEFAQVFKGVTGVGLAFSRGPE
ncbi:hypothetical protein [Singulisphaera acidiphila]|uniref:Uncharacterized protein n=1 Tax=Singulisphaera acidiphila (strain ATCC BAA-1392 / DSM 18658 / VKM B-2454 / MOB10) TaxID=886293 RepID=L0DGX1_SINAD|nr:hypothetical protein [Singulisphaera acidiphila]AGA28512.1 hypothetical protein Sinac_4314 [Singulisphaera acidiphila DSM 18658]